MCYGSCSFLGSGTAEKGEGDDGMPRLIDADALKSNLGLSNNCKTCKIGVTKNCQLEIFEVYGICTMLDDAQTVNVLQKFWNALYAEEDKWEKKFCGTQEHDNWFMNYRPWLQNGFEIAIKVLTELGVKE